MTRRWRKPDPLFTALAKLDSPWWRSGLPLPGRVRGRANRAAASVRAESPGLSLHERAAEVGRRVRMFRRLWPEMRVTSTAIAKHWLLLPAEYERLVEPSYRPAGRSYVSGPYRGLA